MKHRVRNYRWPARLRERKLGNGKQRSEHPIYSFISLLLDRLSPNY